MFAEAGVFPATVDWIKKQIRNTRNTFYVPKAVFKKGPSAFICFHKQGFFPAIVDWIKINWEDNYLN